MPVLQYYKRLRLETQLLAAKARLTPLRTITIPRIELCSAVMAVKADEVLRNELGLDLLPSTFWSDSKVALSYIRCESHRLHVFVANRVARIRSNTAVDQWKYVPTGENPAALNVQDDSRCKGIQGNTPKSEIKCVCLNARSIINKKTELNIMVDDIKPHIIGITESWANNDITIAELGLEGYVMFRKDRIGRMGGGVLLYIKDTIYEVQLQEEADCNEVIWCNLVTGHTTVIIGVVYRCPNITKQNNEKNHNAINEVSKGDCIIMGDFNHGHIKWDTLQSTGVEDSTFLCLVQDNFLTQHVLEPTRAARVLYI